MGSLTLKFILVISSLITMAIGGAVMYITYLKFNDYSQLWQYINSDASKYGQIGFYSLGGVSILTGVFGIFGVLKRNRCLLTIFDIFLLILFAFFAGVGVVITIYTNNQYQDLKNQECATATGNYEWLQQSDNLYVQLGNNLFCSQLCTCYLTNQSAFPTGTFTGKSVTDTDSSAPTCFQNCQIAQQDTQYNDYIPLATFVENNFNCSGICQPMSFYMFSDINRGPPTNTQGCKQSIENFYDKYGNIVRICAFSAAAFLLCQIIFSLWLCCTKKSKKGSPLLNRLVN